VSRKPPERDVDESDLEIEGVPRATRTLRRVNQVDGFDCQGCAWPDPDPEHRHHAVFCENGAKAVTEEATLRRIGRDFFAAHAMADLADKTAIHRSIANVVPGCAAYDEKVDQPGGFVLPHPPRDSREFPTGAGRAVFSVSPIDVLEVPEGRLLLQTLRSHDQFNTTIYGLDDRYRGIKGGRRVVFVHPDDIVHLGFADGDQVDLVSEWRDGSERAATDVRIVSYDQPRGCAAAYYRETNPLVPLDSNAEGSNTPTSKSVVIRLEEPAGRRTGVIRAAVDDDRTGHKRQTDPVQQS
jgi:formate dehydrogenase major subunit